MICIVALVAFAILGIFSAKYRSLAKEAFNCVFRRLTLRSCETGFDRRMKAKIIGKLLARSPKTAGLVFRNFEAISWIFTILMLASIVLSAQGVYNYAVYGNCNGPHSSVFCIFNPEGSGNVSCGSKHCAIDGCICEGLKNCTASYNYAACKGN